jgi:hypothetical protein
MRRTTIAIAALSLVLGACVSGAPGPTSTHSPAPSASPSPEPDLLLPVLTTGFGTLPTIELLGDAPAYAGPSRPRSLDDVLVSPWADGFLSPEAERSIERHGFVVVPGDTRLFWHLYDAIPYGDGTTTYVTTDVAYHSWHLVFDKVLRTLEQDVLLPRLQELVGDMAADARHQRGELAATSMAEAAATVDRLMQVEVALLGGPTPADAAARVEVALIENHSSMEPSPILGATVDYTLFTPRGHYTRNAELTRFFLGMSLLGQAPFAVNGPDVTSDTLAGAVLASRLLVPGGLGSPGTIRAWRDIYEPTAFLVGAADDYTPQEVTEALEQVAAGGMNDPASITDADLDAMRDALLASRAVQIDPENASMRLMGVRFVLDSWILDQLIYPNVGTELDPRVVPSVLDLASVFGSAFAERVQRRAGQEEFEHYAEQVQRLREAVAARPQDGWSGTVYDAWLWAIEPLWVRHGAAYPDTMQGSAWAAKATQTGAGSYAELKHDTILFAKQFAAEGGDGERPYVPRHWVEPEPVAYARLGAAVELMREGLAGRDLLTDEAKGLLVDLGDQLGFFARIAEDELAGEPIAEADNDRIEALGGWLESMWWRTADQTAGGVADADEEAAIVADIGRSIDEVLEVATGRIDTLLIVVPNDEGRFELAVGGVYSFYEFLQPMAERLDDETWRQLLATGEQPERPGWEAPILVTGEE